VVDVSGGGRRRGWSSVRRNLGRQTDGVRPWPWRGKERHRAHNHDRPASHTPATAEHHGREITHALRPQALPARAGAVRRRAEAAARRACCCWASNTAGPILAPARMQCVSEQRPSIANCLHAPPRPVLVARSAHHSDHRPCWVGRPRCLESVLPKIPVLLRVRTWVLAR
jgi:hypothetical protein